MDRRAGIGGKECSNKKGFFFLRGGSGEHAGLERRWWRCRRGSEVSGERRSATSGSGGGVQGAPRVWAALLATEGKAASGAQPFAGAQLVPHERRFRCCRSLRGFQRSLSESAFLPSSFSTRSSAHLVEPRPASVTPLPPGPGSASLSLLPPPSCPTTRPPPTPQPPSTPVSLAFLCVCAACAFACVSACLQLLLPSSRPPAPPLLP